MPFGLTNAPATFQRLMECVLAGLTYKQCLIYLDDIVVFSASVDEHLKRLSCTFTAEVIQMLLYAERGLVFKACRICCKSQA